MNATGNATVTVTLPATAQSGDYVSVRGVSNTPWRLAPNANQVIGTTSLSGNVAPGGTWTPRLAPQTWHWMASSANGDVLVAGAIPGRMSVSTDGGATWSDASSPEGNWISIDMTPNASRIVAVGYFGGMYISNDRGATWTAVQSTIATESFSGREWESVTISEDGQRIAANIINGPVVVSSDGGATWALATSSTAGFAGSAWRAIDSSANGMVVVSAAQTGEAWLSTNGGTSFTRLNVTVNGSAVADGWYRTAISRDGNTIVLVGNEQYSGRASTGLYISRDRGQTWTRASTVSGSYTSVSMSSDASVIGATMSNDGSGSGRVMVSRNGGTSFSALTMPGSDTTWRAMAMSADGNQYLVAAGTFFGTPGQMYTSIGNRTSVGSLGWIGGGQNQQVEVEYLGNNRWNVRASQGGTFTVR